MIFSTMILVLNTSQPITLILALIMTTTLLATKSFITTKISMYSFMIMLAILGGLIILFIYMASLAPNEKFKTNKMILPIYVVLIMMISLWSETPLKLSGPPYLNLCLTEVSFILNFKILVMIISLYLLISLIVIVKITQFKSGPLRSI